MELDDILDEKKTPDPVEKQQEQRNEERGVEVETAPEPKERPVSRKQAHRDKEQEAQGRVRDPETGQYAKAKEPEAEVKPEAKAPEVKPEVKPEAKAPVVAAPPQQEFTEKEKAFLKAAHDERAKRQELERRIAAMEKPPEQPKGFWDDPEAAFKQQNEKIQSVALQTKLQTAEGIARLRYTDFDEKLAKFTELAQNTPGLAQQTVMAPDPAEFAYRTAKNHMEMQEAGGIEGLRKKIEAETTARVRAEVEAELKAKAEEAEKLRSNLPGTLSGVRGVTANKPVWSGPPALDDILKGR